MGWVGLGSATQFPLLLLGQLGAGWCEMASARKAHLSSCPPAHWPGQLPATADEGSNTGRVQRKREKERTWKCVTPRGPALAHFRFHCIPLAKARHRSAWTWEEEKELPRHIAKSMGPGRSAGLWPFLHSATTPVTQSRWFTATCL